LMLASSSPLSSPPQFILNPYEETRSDSSSSRESSPSPGSRRASSTHASNPDSSREVNSSAETGHLSRSDSLGSRSSDRSEIHCAPTLLTRSDTAESTQSFKASSSDPSSQ